MTDHFTHHVDLTLARLEHIAGTMRAQSETLVPFLHPPATGMDSKGKAAPQPLLPQLPDPLSFLLAQWLAESGTPAAWVSLGPGDNDPASFLSYVIAALQTLDTQFGARALALLRTPQTSTAEIVLALIANDLLPWSDFPLPINLMGLHSRGVVLSLPFSGYASSGGRFTGADEHACGDHLLIAKMIRKMLSPALLSQSPRQLHFPLDGALPEGMLLHLLLPDNGERITIMAQSIESHPLSTARVGEPALVGLWKVRLALGWTILFAAVVGLFATSWDIQWHTAVGRDRTLTAPHLFILGSITAMGLVALAAVLVETVWARRRPTLASSGTTFAGFFSGSLGAYLVGYGALDSAIAFPLDQYWHTLYGIDVAIWAPFHIMVLAGFCVSCLGVAFLLADAAQLAAHQGAKWAARAGYAGMIVAFATLMGALTFLLMNSLDMGFIFVGSLAFTVYPLMLGAFGMLVLVAMRRALPWRAAATSVAVVYILFGLVNYLLVPALMTLLLGVEQQHLLPGAPTVSVVGAEWQNWLIIPAVLLDLVAWVAQRKGWALKLVNRMTLIVGPIGITLAALLYPLFLSTAQFYSNPVRRVRVSSELARSARGITSLPHTSVVLIVVVSLLLGLLGTYVGNWFGAGIGESMRRKER